MRTTLIKTLQVNSLIEKEKQSSDMTIHDEDGLSGGGGEQKSLSSQALRKSKVCVLTYRKAQN